MTQVVPEARPTVVLQADGKIVVGGTTIAKSGESVDSTGKLALVRYEPDGRLDPTFGRGGKATSGFGKLGYAEDVVLLAGGRIAVAVGNDLGLFEVARYLPNGTPDKMFGKEGVARASFGGQFDVATSVGVQADGMLIGAGTTYNSAKEEQRFALARFIDSLKTICHVPSLKRRRPFGREGRRCARSLLGGASAMDLLEGAARAGHLPDSARRHSHGRGRESRSRRQHWGAMTRQLGRSTSWVVAHPLRFRIWKCSARRRPPRRASPSGWASCAGRSATTCACAGVGAIVEAPELGTKRERWWRRERGARRLSERP